MLMKTLKGRTWKLHHETFHLTSTNVYIYTNLIEQAPLGLDATPSCICKQNFTLWNFKLLQLVFLTFINIYKILRQI